MSKFHKFFSDLLPNITWDTIKWIVFWLLTSGMLTTAFSYVMWFYTTVPISIFWSVVICLTLFLLFIGASIVASRRKRTKENIPPASESNKAKGIKVGYIECRVVDDNNNYLVGAVCTAENEKTGRKYTGAIGRQMLEINVPYGQYQVTAEMEGFLPHSEFIVVGSDEYGSEVINTWFYARLQKCRKESN